MGGLKKPRINKRELYTALNALRQISIHIGLIPSAKVFEPTLEQQQESFKKNLKEIAFYLVIALDKKAPPLLKAVSWLILDIHVYGWRKCFSAEGIILDRDDPKVLKWRKRVLERDLRICVKCSSDKNLHAHHIISWVDAPCLRADIDNGKTLCVACHKEEHSGQAA